MKAIVGQPTSVGRFVKIVTLCLASSLFYVAAPFSANVSFGANGDPIGADTFNDAECNLGDGIVANHTSAGTAFQLSTADQLWEVADCSGSGVYFELMNDIAMSSRVHAPYDLPIGFVNTTSVTEFSGVLDGKGYQITGIAMATTNHGAGLFAHLKDATIKNLSISGSFSSTGATNDPSSYQQSGSLAMYASGSLTVEAFSTSASMAGQYRVGGLVGTSLATATLTDSYNAGPVTGELYVGGLVGAVSAPLIISKSRNSGPISGPIGGPVTNYAGGLIGYHGADTTIDSSYNEGTVSGGNPVGGIIGFKSSTITITNSYNSGNVSGTKTGAFFGINNGGGAPSISTSYNSGAIGASTTGTVYSAVPTATTPAIADMKASAAFSGFDFATTWAFGLSTDNDGFPILRLNSNALAFFTDVAGYPAVFDTQGGSSVDGGAFNPSSPLQLPSPPGLSGFDFSGWSLSIVGSTVSFPYSPGVSSQITLYAQWQEITYNVTFDAQSGTSVALQNTASLATSPATTQSGFIFQGWFDAATDGTQITFPYAPSADVTLYAQWVSATPPAPAPYTGALPTGYSNAKPSIGDEVVVSGVRLNLVTSCTIDGVTAVISNQSADSFTIVIPAGLEPGLKDLVISSTAGTLTAQGAFTVEAKAAITESPAKSSKVNSGSFNGYIAVYAKGHEGKALAWKIAGKWFKTTVASDYQVFQRRTAAAGIDVDVHLYIDGEKQLTKTVTTR